MRKYPLSLPWDTSKNPGTFVFAGKQKNCGNSDRSKKTCMDTRDLGILPDTRVPNLTKNDFLGMGFPGRENDPRHRRSILGPSRGFRV